MTIAINKTLMYIQWQWQTPLCCSCTGWGPLSSTPWPTPPSCPWSHLASCWCLHWALSPHTWWCHTRVHPGASSSGISVQVAVRSVLALLGRRDLRRNCFGVLKLEPATAAPHVRFDMPGKSTGLAWRKLGSRLLESESCQIHLRQPYCQYRGGGPNPNCFFLFLILLRKFKVFISFEWAGWIFSGEVPYPEIRRVKLLFLSFIIWNPHTKI